jgi:hypothetical protein
MRYIAYASCSSDGKMPQVRSLNPSEQQILPRVRYNDFVEGAAMSESRRQLLTIGVFFIATVVAILLYAVGVFVDWLNIFPVIFTIFGGWMLVLAGIRAQNPQKHEREPFGTLEMGVLLIALGGCWLLWRTNPLYSVALILFVLGAVAIVAALRRKTP